MERVNDTFLLVGRLLMAALFLAAGIPKALGGYVDFAGYLGELGVPSPEMVAIVATAVEIIAPIALILGVLPRITSLLLIAFVIVATVLAHRFWEAPPEALQGEMNSFLKNVAIIGGLLFYYVSGPGAWALAGRGARADAEAEAEAEAQA